MLIRAYGLYWNPDAVRWNQDELVGATKLDADWYNINYWEAQGVYVLLRDFVPVYVGKAISRKLGPRVQDHLTDRFAGRWDMFSWFSISRPAKLSLGVTAPGTRALAPETVIDTLEALSILITDPPLNRKRESIPDAHPAEQVRSPHPHTIRHYLELLLQKTEAIEARMDH
jgi:hypothetical protein